MEIGETVTIRVKSPINPARYAPGAIREFYEYTGTVVNNAKHLGNDVISLTTDDPYYPIRVVDRDRIVGAGGVLPPKASSVKTFRVEGSKKGTFYTVTQDKSSWSCTCVGFGFRRDCKHIRECKG